MNNATRIESISARQVFSDRGHPGVEAKVVTMDGSCGLAIVTAGKSVGKHEVHFVYDGGEKWGGLGVLKAVDHVNTIIAPALRGKDATNQQEIDDVLLALDATPDKSKLGGNAIASVSAAVLKAGAASLRTPLYRYIGGLCACVLPAPGVFAAFGSHRYGGGDGGGGKPTYSFYCYGFNSFGEASHACWKVRKAYVELLRKRYRLVDFSIDKIYIPAGVFTHDRELWELMTEAIALTGNQGKVGIQVDAAASSYYDADKDVYAGLFSREDKTRDDLIKIYKEMVQNYQLVILEDPLEEDDFEGHSKLTRDLGIEIVGDDIFATNIHRFKRGIEAGACNAVLLKVNQIGTISEAFEVVQLAYRSGYAVMPCNSRGEGADLADYAVGLGTGHLREGGLDVMTNRFLEIETELGSRARFLGRSGFKP